MRPLLLTACCSLLAAALASSNPKIFVQERCIEVCDPMRHGFTVHLPKKLMETQLLAKHRPTLYVSAVPLKYGLPAFRKSYFETIHSHSQILEIEENAWYYVCVEFENEHPERRTGNTSTTCERRRTLDKFGAPGDAFVTEVRKSAIANTTIEFQISVDVDFPIELEAYLERAPRIQAYYLDSPKSFRMTFSDLVPGYNYGRLCLIERDVLPHFTALGRSIDIFESKCYFDNLRTLASDLPPSRQRRYYGVEKKSSSSSHIHGFVMYVFCLVFMHIYFLA